MPKSGRKAKSKFTQVARQEENHKLSLHEQLARFEWFRESILPAMQEDLASGISADKLREKYHAIIQASLISTALMDRDAGKRIAAAKDVIDRTEGKAKERAEHTHKLENADEDQVRSLLLSKLAKAGLTDGDDETSVQH